MKKKEEKSKKESESERGCVCMCEWARNAKKEKDNGGNKLVKRRKIKKKG